MNKIFTNVLVALSFIVFASSAFAQSGVGKISGKIVDADTREPLIGANIIILNTNLGAATDIEGNYFILNITPGTYDAKVSYVGYAPKTIQGVRIVANLTYELNVELSTDFTLPEIVVEDKKFFEQNATNTVKVIDSDQISRLPVKGIQNVVSLTSGVVIQEGSGGQDGNATINVRGGRGGEVLYIIDGVPQNNILNNTNQAQVSDNSIEQVSFQVGGYEAKYGQAQSGIVNITTKSGQSYYNIFADGITSTGIDQFGYNLYTLNLSGPIIPGNPNHTIFLSGERGWLKDADPPGITLEYPSIGKSSEFKEGNESSLWRGTLRTASSFGNFRLNLGLNYNTRDNRNYIYRYSKNNPRGNPFVQRENLSASGRLSQMLSSNSFWNLNVGYRKYSFEQSDETLRDNLFLYGDSTYFANTFGVTLQRDGVRTQVDPSTGKSFTLDENGIFFPYGRVNNFYGKNEDEAWNIDVDFTTQIDNNLLEFGAGGNLHTVRNYGIGPVSLAGSKDTLTADNINDIFALSRPSYYGYDVTGRTKTNGSDPDKFARPKRPILAYAYLQDRFELADIVLNIGLRVDYFDTKTDILRDPSLPYAFGNPEIFDAPDFVQKKSEFELSPRIGLGFPITESTVFHAQYGRFIQLPALADLYTGLFDLSALITDDSRTINAGGIISEKTTQYEIGFRQLLGNNSAMNITLFYKNIEGLVNRGLQFFQRVEGGERLKYFNPINTDFGTSKGLAFSLDVTRLSYFSLSLQYTFAIAEGTGSSTSSSITAVFRNINGEVPKVIAPLDFDQKHTGTLVLDFYVPQGEGGIFEMIGLNMLFSFASGRPYTPLNFFDILSGNNGGPSTIGYVNSRNRPGTFRWDLKLEKSFSVGENTLITPYLWVQNVLGTANVTNVWRSTGDPYTTGWLNTEDGVAAVERNGKGFEQDYKSLERNPGNFGIPRLIRLGLKLNFTRLGL